MLEEEDDDGKNMANDLESELEDTVKSDFKPPLARVATNLSSVIVEKNQHSDYKDQVRNMFEEKFKQFDDSTQYMYNKVSDNNENSLENRLQSIR